LIKNKIENKTADMTAVDKIRRRLSLTRTIPKPNEYIIAIDNEYKNFAFNEERAPLLRGLWREQVFQVSSDHPVDLEIGTGNGNHFAHHSKSNPDRCLVGLEIKYKPLIQSIRKALNFEMKNARICRFLSHNVDQLFLPHEINNVFIHFPDPWERPSRYKNRIVQKNFLDIIYELQRPGSFLEFKTDSRDYFLWARKQIAETQYKVEFETLDLHNSERAENNFITTFEKIFIKQNIPINYILLKKP
jgi:tRNA (guanine-N7-)-methyltransferase